MKKYICYIVGMFLLVNVLLPGRSLACSSCELQYKGFSESSDMGYVAHEFDKIAPQPGVNWQGDIKDWLVNAEKKGWQVSKDLHGAKSGAIAVFIKKGTKKDYSVIGIVKEVTPTFVVIEYPRYDFDSRQFKSYLSREYYDDYQKFGDGSFRGYIWPERIKALGK